MTTAKFAYKNDATDGIKMRVFQSSFSICTLKWIWLVANYLPIALNKPVDVTCHTSVGGNGCGINLVALKSSVYSLHFPREHARGAWDASADPPISVRLWKVTKLSRRTYDYNASGEEMLLETFTATSVYCNYNDHYKCFITTYRRASKTKKNYNSTVCMWAKKMKSKNLVEKKLELKLFKILIILWLNASIQFKPFIIQSENRFPPCTKCFLFHRCLMSHFVFVLILLLNLAVCGTWFLPSSSFPFAKKSSIKILTLTWHFNILRTTHFRN